DGAESVGLAVANPSSTPAEATLTLVNRQGQPGSAVTLRLPGRNQIWRSIAEIIPGSEKFDGSVAVTSTQSLSAITMKLEGAQLTALPVLPGASTAASIVGSLAIPLPLVNVCDGFGGTGPGPMIIRDNLAFLAAGGAGVVVIDITNPTSPRIFSQI